MAGSLDRWDRLARSPCNLKTEIDRRLIFAYHGTVFLPSLPFLPFGTCVSSPNSLQDDRLGQITLPGMIAPTVRTRRPPGGSAWHEPVRSALPYR